MENYKMYKFKGAEILALENGEEVIFFMNYKSNDFIFCGAIKAKLSEITDEEILVVWRDFFDMVIIKETVLIEHEEEYGELDNNEE
jgi:hypothetical protein